MVRSDSVSALSIELVEQVKAKNCIVFVGPDLSLPDGSQLGPPSPSLLALELALQLGGQFEDYSLPWIAQYYVDRYDATALNRFVVDRLDPTLYRPTLIHFLLVQLPFSMIVYLAQDDLLSQAFRRCKVQVNEVLESDAALGEPNARELIQPYGSVTSSKTLKLTEDERRSVFDKTDLAEYLRVQIRSRTSLFFGCPQDDPDFREFFRVLRPNVNQLSRRSHLIQAEIQEGDQKYWSERNAVIVQRDTLAFLQEMAATLGLAIQEDRLEEPASINEAERARREKIMLDFSHQLGLDRPVESRAQLQSIATGLATLHRAISDHKKTGIAMTNEMPSNQDLEARLSLQEGNIEWAEGNPTQAQEAFEKAIRLDPNLIDAYVSLHHLLVENGEMEAAARVYQQIAELDPTRAFIPPRYKLLNVLGLTSVGISYHCRDEVSQQEVVVTILGHPLAHQTEVLAEFERQISSLKSPRISQLLELNSFHARSYVVMEYFEARSLRKLLDDPANEAGRLSQAQVFEILNQTMEALQVGEQQGIPHLSLQPENILWTQRGVVLTNYGFSRLANSLRRSGRALSRPHSDYEAPEQKTNEIGDQRSDVYALGTILYEMLTGRTPGLGEYRTVSEVNPQTSETLDVLIDHARAYDPAKRFQTVDEMRTEIHRILLSTEYHALGQYTRIFLARVSNLYAALLSRKGIWLTLGVLLFLLIIGNARLGLGDGLVAGIRVLCLLLVTSLVTSLLGYFVVREWGRERGLGSLIYSGRGMGAILGLLSTAFLIHYTGWGTDKGLAGVETVNYLGYLFIVSLAVVVLMVIVELLLIHMAGWVFERRARYYTRGFYSGLWGVVILLLLLIVLPSFGHIISF